MEFNLLFIIFIIVMLLFIIRGANRGMIRIIYSLVAWGFLIIFVNYASYLTLHTELPSHVEELIGDHLHKKYEASEEKEAGSGQDAVISVVPEFIMKDIEQSVQTSIDNTIKAISEDLTGSAIKGISTILSIAIGIILIVLVDTLLRAIGFVPGLRDVNKLLGVIAGAAEGLLFTWLIMYLANCFPATTTGQFIITYAKANQVMNIIYTNNPIERIIGI